MIYNARCACLEGAWGLDSFSLHCPIFRAVEGLLAIPNGLAIPNTPPFVIDTDRKAFFICSLMARFFCINGVTHRSTVARTVMCRQGGRG